jgi:hypothetical protein
MPLSQDRIVFGIHSITPYDRLTGLPFGILKVVGSSELSFAADSVDLRGGSNKYPVANEVVSVDSQFTSEVKSQPDFLFEKWAGASVTTTAASATGTVTAIANKKGTSVFDATTGIASVAAKSGSEDDLKFGRYVLKAVTPSTIDVYVDTDVDFKTKGAEVSFDDDLLKITATPLTVPGTGGTVDIADFGIEITGGSGTVAFTAGDTAYFDVYPAHGGVSEIVMGQPTIEFPEFGMIIYAQNRSDGSQYRIEAFKAKSSAGIIIPLEEGGFSIPNLTTKLLYDSCEEKVVKITAIAGAGTTC